MITRRNLFSILLKAAGLLLGELSFARSYGHEVLAFYHGRYANPEVSGRWAHWLEGSAHEPQIGRYDSHDPKVIETQLNQAKSAGLTGLIVSWWRRGDFQDQGLHRAWLRTANKPVVFAYARALNELQLTGWPRATYPARVATAGRRISYCDCDPGL